MSRIIEMIGRLATDNEIKRFPEDNRTAIFINGNNELQYKIRSISVKNDIYEEFFTGYLNSIENIENLGFVDDSYESREVRMSRFREFFEDRLFIFTHRVDQFDNYKIDSSIVVSKTSAIKSTKSFIAIPLFTSKSDFDYINSFPLFKTCETYEEFKQHLFENKSIGRVYNHQKTEENMPEFLIWKDTEKMVAIGPIKSVSFSSMNSLSVQIDESNYNEVMLYDSENDDALIEYAVMGDNKTLLHMDLEKYDKIVQALSKKENNTKNEPVERAEVENTETKAETKEESRELEPKYIDEAIINEKAIFDMFMYHCHSQKNKLFYNPKDIVNFHTALKTGSLVILSGMSGTGKSALVDAYAEALNIKKNKLVIPVRPSWNDDSDLLGYVDLIHNVYRASDTGFIDKIVEASKEENKNNLYLICFDEMNLARVEHYFSQFLSVLEKPVGSNRELVLYSKKYENQLYNAKDYPSSVPIGENIRFVGTVNIDESTYHFSDKVLDRANVITLDVLDYSNKDNWKVEKYIPKNISPWTKDEFKMLIKDEETVIEKADRLREFLWNTHLVLHDVNPSLGVGPRILKSIENYLRNIPEEFNEFTLSFGEGLDYQVAQRILTKVRGPEEQIKNLFEKGSAERKTLADVFNDFGDLSDFKNSKMILEQKEKELSVYGYCV